MRQLPVSTHFVSIPTLRAQLRCTDREIRQLLKMPGIRMQSGLVDLTSARQVFNLMLLQESHQEHRGRVYG